MRRGSMSESEPDDDYPEDTGPARIELDFEELAEGKDFKKIDWEIFQEIKRLRQGPEPDPEDSESDSEEDEPLEFDFEMFLEDYNPYNIENEAQLEEWRNRLRYVYELGIYGGERHPDSDEREGNGHALYPNGDEYVGPYHENLKHGPNGTYWFRSVGPSDEDKLIQTEIENAPRSIQDLIRTTHYVEAAKRIRNRLSKRGERISIVRIRFVLEYGAHPFYVGAFVEDRRHGLGMMKYLNGTFYKGCWKNGKRHGEGVVTYPNMDVYDGDWKHGKKHGPGTYLFKKIGVSYEGDWFEGEMVRGVWKMSDGTVYEGEFQGNIPAGNGLFRFRDNVCIQGVFSDGEWQPGFSFLREDLDDEQENVDIEEEGEGEMVY